jgi:CBS domain-containing protein
MDSDLIKVHEREPLDSLMNLVQKSTHPFIAVVDSGGLYLGLVSVDQVVAAAVASRSLEARDLLGRSGAPMVGAVRSDEPLRVLAGRFTESPCFPVIDVESRPVGLIFAYRFRSAYEGALERRSLQLDQ